MSGGKLASGTVGGAGRNFSDGESLAASPSRACDPCLYPMKRTLLVFAAMLLCSPVWSQSQYQPVPFEEIAGPNRSIRDPKSGVSATVPLGWMLRRAGRKENGETSITL